MGIRRLLGVVLVLAAGCGGGHPRFARNVASREHADIYSCRVGEVKSKILREIADRPADVIYLADVQTTGCGGEEEYRCAYKKCPSCEFGAEWDCRAAARYKAAPGPTRPDGLTDVPPGKGWACFIDTSGSGNDPRPFSQCFRTMKECTDRRTSWTVHTPIEKVSECVAAEKVTCLNYRDPKAGAMFHCAVDPAECELYRTEKDATGCHPVE